MCSGQMWTISYFAVILTWISRISLTTADLSGCPSLRNTYRMTSRGARCFQYSYLTYTWKDARDYCSQNTGRLVNIDSEETSDFLKGNLRGMSWNTEHMWIGLNDINEDNTWTWVGQYGEPDVPQTWRSDWMSGYPRSNYWYQFGHVKCAIIRKDGRDWKWKNKECNKSGSKYKFICEYELEEVPTLSSEHFTTTDLTTHQRTTLKNKMMETTEAESMFTTEPFYWKEAKEIDPPSSKFEPETSKMEVEKFQPGVQSNIEGQTGEGETQQLPVYVVVLAFVAGALVATALTIFLVCQRKRRTKGKPEVTQNEIYLTTTKSQNAESSKPDYSNTNVLKRAISRLPELPTDGGYEIPVNLLGATNCKAATVQDETSGDAASGGKVVEEDQEDVEEDEAESTDVYQVIPVDDDAVEDANAVYQSIA